MDLFLQLCLLLSFASERRGAGRTVSSSTSRSVTPSSLSLSPSPFSPTHSISCLVGQRRRHRQPKGRDEGLGHHRARSERMRTSPPISLEPHPFTCLHPPPLESNRRICGLVLQRMLVRSFDWSFLLLCCCSVFYTSNCIIITTHARND